MSPTIRRAADPARGAGDNRQGAPQEKITKGSSAAAPRKIKFNVGERTSKFMADTQGNAYEVLDVIGEGAYGVVISALHRPSGTKVAIKKIAPFDHSMFALRTLRELKLLKYFAEEGLSENVRIIRCFANNRSFPCSISSDRSRMNHSKRVSPCRFRN